MNRYDLKYKKHKFHEFLIINRRSYLCDRSQKFENLCSGFLLKVRESVPCEFRPRFSMNLLHFPGNFRISAATVIGREVKTVKTERHGTEFHKI